MGQPYVRCEVFLPRLNVSNKVFFLLEVSSMVWTQDIHLSEELHQSLKDVTSSGKSSTIGKVSQNLARLWFELNGYEVGPLPNGAGADFRCNKNGESLLVEVKGTESSGTQARRNIILTDPEKAALASGQAILCRISRIGHVAPRITFLEYDTDYRIERAGDRRYNARIHRATQTDM